MADRFTELAEKRAELLTQLEVIETELRAALDGDSTATVRAPKKDKVRQPRRTTVQSESSDGDRQPSLKEIVQNVLSQHPQGLEMKAVVKEIIDLIKRGEYHSKAKKIASVVSQALFSLKSDGLVTITKSPETDKNLYKVAA